MRSTFFGLEMARRAISSHRTALDVVGHNIANANTEGFRKRDIVLSPSDPMPLSGAGQPIMGTGVQVETIRRRQDQYLDREIHRRTGEAQMWETRGQVMQQVEDILGEPGEGGLSSVMDRFFNSWQDLASEPDNPAMRTSVIERGHELGDAFAMLRRQLENMAGNLTQTIENRVGRVNDMLEELSEVNHQIVTAEAGDSAPNDLLDRRDVLTERLSGLLDVAAAEEPEGGVRLIVDGIPVMESFSHRRLELAIGGDDQVQLQWSKDAESGIDWEPDGIGGLGALVRLRNEDVPGLRADLAALADGIRDAVNEVHADGYDLHANEGNDESEPVANFFAEIDGVISVSDEIIAHPSRIRAAGENENGEPAIPGDGSVAAQIGDLRHESMNGLQQTPAEYLRSVVADVGIRSEQAQKMHQNNDAMLAQLLNQRDAVTGVSIDEELTHLIQAQHAFGASARMVAVWDEMLSTIVNGLVR